MASDGGLIWDARAEQDIGVMLARYLRDNPAPAGSELAADFTEWSMNLRSDAAERLGALGVAPLRTAAGGDA